MTHKYLFLSPYFQIIGGHIDLLIIDLTINKKNLKKRSQDLENLYVPNGSIWISKISKLKKKKSFYSDNYGHFFTNFIESIDIDNTEEFEFAESLKHEK